MNKNTKKIIGIVIILVLILAVIWVAYESFKPEPASINSSNDLPDENKDLANIINDVMTNETTNTVNETANNEVDENVINGENSDENEEVADNTETSNGSETVEGSTKSREEKAVELAKEFYEKEYGSTEGIYFRYDSISGDGKYRVVASQSGGKTVAFLLVDLSTEEVTKK